MKQEFKKGDRVLVRKTDLHEWTPAVFDELDNLSYWFTAVLNDGYRGVFYQCRHIDDFRTGDKVQVRDSETDEWQDAICAVYVPHAPYQHWVFSEDVDGFTGYKLCRWHPSMPWAKKEKPLTLEQRVEALERKLTDQ